MATWIAHLRIAENLLDMIPGLDAAQFAVGNVAPDSGLPDAKWETFTPPTEVTHFQARDRCPYHSADLEFYWKYLRPLPWPGSDVKQYSFLWGYFCHLVADNLWSIHIGKPTRARFQAQFEANRDFIWEVKKDWYGLDFVYVRTHPQSLYWRTFLTCDYPINYLDVLLPEGVRQRIEYIQTYYQRTDAHAEELCSRERVYLTEEEVAQFVAVATQQLAQAYQRLPDPCGDAGGFCSILDWPQ